MGCVAWTVSCGEKCVVDVIVGILWGVDDAIVGILWEASVVWKMLL